MKRDAYEMSLLLDYYGALLTDSRLQYESDPAAAIERAVKELKQWVTVV